MSSGTGIMPGGSAEPGVDSGVDMKADESWANCRFGDGWMGLMGLGWVRAPCMKSFSKALILCCMALFSSVRRPFLFSRCRMYSVALLRTWSESPG